MQSIRKDAKITYLSFISLWSLRKTLNPLVHSKLESFKQVFDIIESDCSLKNIPMNITTKNTAEKPIRKYFYFVS